MDLASADKIICPECGHKIEHNLDDKPTYFIDPETGEIVGRQRVEVSREDPAVIQTRIDHFNEDMATLTAKAEADCAIMDDYTIREVKA